MIKRVWRGWTTVENAAAYEELLLNEVIPAIIAKNLPGYSATEVLRETLEDEVEFSTVMTFDTIDNVKAFQGEDYSRCYVPDAAKAVLSRWDTVCRHYECVAVKAGSGGIH